MSGSWRVARSFIDATDFPLHNPRVTKGIFMNATSKVLGLVLLTLGATLAHAAPARAPAAPRVAVNPQPLPPRHIDSGARIAINPQPLPPRDRDPQLRKAMSKPYIGETEKNLD